jgi:hypothetical protein
MEEKTPKKNKKKQKPKGFSLFTSRTAVATAALFVSVCSLILTISQMRANKEAQYLSVLPYVSCGISNGNLIDEKHSSFDMIIQNKGIGPAFLHSVMIKCKDKVFEGNDFRAAIQYLLDSNENLDFSYSSVNKNTLIPANSDILWFHPQDTKQAHDFLKRNWSVKNEFVTYICFGDVYGRKWTVNSENDEVIPCDKCPEIK